MPLSDDQSQDRLTEKEKDQDDPVKDEIRSELEQMDKNKCTSRRLYFNESSLRPSLKLSSFQRQYHDHIDSKVIPDSFRLAAFIKFTFLSEFFSFLVPQLDFFHSLAHW